jgi:hypothetical protein
MTEYAHHHPVRVSTEGAIAIRNGRFGGESRPWTVMDLAQRHGASHSFERQALSDTQVANWVQLVAGPVLVVSTDLPAVA